MFTDGSWYFWDVDASLKSKQAFSIAMFIQWTIASIYKIDRELERFQVLTSIVHIYKTKQCADLHSWYLIDTTWTKNTP